MNPEHDQLIYNNRPDKLPVRLSWSGNQLTIDCCLRFNNRALRTGPAVAPGRTYAELVSDGIRRHWSGQYELGSPEYPDPVTVCVVIQTDQKRRHVPVKVRPMFFMPAHVISPFYRRIWGIFRTGQIESLGLNWSPQQPGAIMMPPYEQVSQVESVAAHEMGHILGIGDAYGAIYRFYYAAPGTQNYMMHSNRQVQPQEIKMMLLAHKSGRMQFFPKKWDTRQFLHGLRQEVKSTAQRIRQRLRRAI
jgi:hypothetical protein